MKNKPLPIGITGGIGAGKSIITKIFELLHIPVYNADQRAKWLMNHDEMLKRQIIEVFGVQAYREGQLDRVYIGKLAFNHPEYLNQLNGLVHPTVGLDFEQWHNQQQTPYTLKEAALLFEAGSYQQLHQTILVTAPESLRIKRVLLRDSHRTKADVKSIINNQWPEEKKRKLADYIIHNDESQLVIPHVLSIHQKILLLVE